MFIDQGDCLTRIQYICQVRDSWNGVACVAPSFLSVMSLTILKIGTTKEAGMLQNHKALQVCFKVDIASRSYPG